MLENTLVPIVIMTSMFAMVFGIVYLGSRERMAMIEKGMNPRTREPRPQHFVNLRRGLLLIGAGLGLLIAYLTDTFIFAHQVVVTNFSINSRDSDNPALYFALVALGGGLGLFISYRIEKKEWQGKKTDALN